MRRLFYEQFEDEAWRGKGVSPVNVVIICAVVASVLIVVFQSEPEIRAAAPGFFSNVVYVFAALFTAEFTLRLWAVGENPEWRGVGGRLRYALRWSSLLDIGAILAIWVDILVGIPGVYGVVLRIARLMRILSLARNSLASKAMRLLWTAIFARRMELAMSFAIAFVMLLLAAVALFAIEGDEQPEQFGSIPRAMWWSMATLTTVGYGDVYPITALGKIVAAVAALTSIAIVGMPAGIMAAAFSDAFQDLQEPPEEDENQALDKPPPD